MLRQKKEENEKLEQEFKEKNRREREKQKKEREENERKEKENKEREKIEKEMLSKQKKEEYYFKNFPDGISSNDNIANKKIKFIHIDIEFVSQVKEVEIFDINSPQKEGYKVIKFQDSKYFSVFPFYKTDKKYIYFGIREIDTKLSLDGNIISKYECLKYNKEKERFELKIIKSDIMKFDIYNVPARIKGKEEIHYLKLLQQLNLKNYNLSFYKLKEVTKSLKYSEILDLLMEIGINKLSEDLIKILIDRKIEIFQISDYLEKNKNSKFQGKDFSKIAPNIIFNFTNSKEEYKENDNELIIEENIQKKRDCLLCCDKNIPLNINSEEEKKDLIPKTIEKLGNLSLEYNKLDEKRKEINDKLSKFNKIQKKKGLKEIACILTDTTVKKIYQLELGIQASIAMIIQGFTSAGKSFLSKVASNINERECLSTALSEHTTIEDLLGRDVIKKDSSINFIPGILLIAYSEGKTLILDECDLAQPDILSCILGSISKSELIVNNKIYRKMDGYNVILTMNGEVKGFNEKQRNVLTSNILSKFIIIPFDEMEKEECREIFENLLMSNERTNDYITNLDDFIELHQELIDDMKKNEKSIDPIVTLRNLNYIIYFSKNNIPPRIAAEISYTARFPKEERKYENTLNKLGRFQMDESILQEIEIKLKENFLFYNESYVRSAYLALTACRAGLHPLLIGKKGCGLTTFAKFIASLYNNNGHEFLFCCSETSVEDLIGCYQPKLKKKDNIQDLSDYIKWNNGPILRACEKGISVILDNINYSKPQVIECLNPLLENNSKYNINFKYNVLEKENKEPVPIKQGFVIIGTMVIDEENKNVISKALMNRFVAIYLDEYLEINEQNLKDIIDNTEKKLNRQLKESFENYEERQNFNDSDENDSISYQDIIEESEEEEEGEEEENRKIPDWFNIKEISSKTINDIKNFLNFKTLNIKVMKTLIKMITKLSLIYERINQFGFSIKDCYDLIHFNFNAKRESYKLLQEKILKESMEPRNRFFFDDFGSDSWKMIMIMISSNLSNTSIFLQGFPGSGKSCAARHYGAYRNFNNRNPILSINCHRDLKFDYLVGNYNFKNSKFQFVEGPLLIAMKNGEPILLDEFNLCPENILINLLPILKANINDKVYLKGVPEPVNISPGFIIIATGNSNKEKGRNKLSSIISDELNIMEINNFDFDKNNILKNILEQEFSEIFQPDDSYNPFKISSLQIKEINRALKDLVQFKLSLRQIKCLLERIKRFCLEDNYQTNGLIRIPVIYIVISYIIPQLKIGVKTNELLKSFNSIMRYNKLNEILGFISSKVEIESTMLKVLENEEEKNFIKKGKIYLETRMKKDYLPQVALQIYFWIRMSCSLKDESPSEENLLLAGTTCYKEFLLNEWLNLSFQKNIIDTLFLTKNTEIENLIGNSSLDNEEKLDIQIKKLIDMGIYYFHLEIENDEDYESKLQLIKKERKKKQYFEKECLNYIYKCILKLQHLRNSFDENNNQIGLKTVTSFNLGIIPIDFIFGKKLILKGLENPEPSVVERLNSVLENPRYLILTEDNQEIFNNDKIFRKIYKTNKKSIPLNHGFSIFFTSREFFHGKTSEAFLSRCTVILCPNYENENYLTIQLKPEENYKIICKSIVKNESLEKEILFLNKNLFKIEVLRFIRWCKSTRNIYQKIQEIKCYSILNKNNIINYKYIVGIAALRSIIDRFDQIERIDIINNQFFNKYLPEKLYELLTSEFNKNLEECPFEKIEKNNKKYIISKYSGIILEYPNHLNPNLDSLENIKWTKSSIDIADAILVSLISKTILILEGPPGRGKTAITKAVYNYLFVKNKNIYENNYEKIDMIYDKSNEINHENIRRINFSLSTSIEDVFSRVIPKINGEKVSTERKEQELLNILRLSKGSTEYYRYGLILDEINLASDKLLEFLYSYLTSIFHEDGPINNKNYISPDGVKYENIGNIGVVATMNDSKISNRTSLSNSFLNLCHLFKLPNYSSNEIELLSEKIIRKESNQLYDKEKFKRVMNCYLISEKYSRKYSETGGNTFREILKLGQFMDKCEEVPIEYLLELILSVNIPQSEIENFKKESELDKISNSFNDLKLRIDNKYLCFGNLVKYKLINQNYYEIKTQFTISQKEAIMKIMIGLLAEKPILLIGENGTGKTFIIEKLSEIIGAKLKVIQFNSETTSLDIVGRLELTVDIKKINDLKKSLKEFMDNLIVKKYKNITEFINKIEKLDIPQIKYFLEDNEINIPEELKEKSKKIIKQLDSLDGIKKTNFNFSLSVLIKAMREGDWILLDDINFAPQEIEGLMSLLEEEPTLTIYENDPVLFFTKDKSKIKNEKTDFEIHPNFRLFITSSNDMNISSAIKSRCLCIKIRPFKEAKDYAELISNTLINTGIDENNIIEISKKIGNAFYNLKENENPSNYILKNYKLSSVNLVNLSKIIISKQPINEEKLSQIIEFSIFSSFKKDNKIENINSFKDSLKEDIKFEITPISNIKRSHEYYLKICEINIISYYYSLHDNEENILELINNKIEGDFSYESKLKDNLIRKNITIDSIIKEISSEFLLNKIELFTLPEIKEYIKDIEEVIIVLQKFFEEKDELYQYFYFLIYLKEILNNFYEIFNIEKHYLKISGIKINKMINNKIKGDSSYESKLKGNIIRKNITIDSIIKEISSDFLLNKIELFTLPEIKEYIKDIEEVIIVLQKFFDEKNELYQYFYFLIYLKDILNNFYKIFNIEKHYLKLSGIKINKMIDNKNYFIQIGIEEEKAIKYSNRLSWFRNMIECFNEIIPQKISVLNLQKSIILICYQFYKNEIDNNHLIYFKMLSNKNLRKILKKFDLKSLNNSMKELYDILLFYEDEIEIDEKNEKIILNNLTISLNNIDIPLIKEVFKNKKIENFYDEIEINNKYLRNCIIYYYPKELYKNETLLQIFWFFNIFVREYIEDGEIEKIIPKELYDFNKLIDCLFRKSTDNKIILNNNKEIIKLGYKLLEGISQIKESEKEIKFLKGIDLFQIDNKENSVDKALEKIDKIKRYFKDIIGKKKIWDSIKSKVEILEKSKESYIFENAKNELEENLNNINKNYNKINKYGKYKFLEEEIIHIKNLIEQKEKTEKIEKKIKDLNEKILKIQKCETEIEQTEEKENDLSQILSCKNPRPSLKAIIIQKYSKLCAIIDEFRAITNSYRFFSRVIIFQNLMKISIIPAYNEQLFKECNNNSNVTPETIKIFKHLANAHLISNIVKNNLEESFIDYIYNILKVKDDIIKDLGAIFGDNDSIYLPKISYEDIIYCFKYGQDKNICGELNSSNFNNFNVISIEENYFIKLRDEIIKKIKDKACKEEMKNYIIKIEKLYIKIGKIKYDFKCNWLLKPIEQLKEECFENPNKVLIKYKFQNLLDFKDNIFDGEKIKAKILYSSLEGNKCIQEENSKYYLINKLICELQKSNNNYKYGYRIMGFFGFHLFEDNISKTMLLIIKSIDILLKKPLKLVYDNKDFSSIVYNIYKEFIESIISNQSPKIENLKIINIFNYLLYSYSRRYIQIYNEQMNNNQKDFERKQLEFLSLIEKMGNSFFQKINYEDEEYKNRDLISKGIKIIKKIGEYIPFPYKKNRQSEQRRFENIINNLFGMENEKDLNTIKKLIKDNIIRKNDYIEKTIYEQYLDIKGKLISSIEIIEKLKNKHYKKIGIKNNQEFSIYLIKESKLDAIKFTIEKLKEIKNDLFKIENIPININDYSHAHPLEKINIKQNTNFIFKKNGKVTFLKKNMKINLGIYILNNQTNDIIGSDIIFNIIDKSFKLSIIQDKNSIITMTNENKDLNPFEDLKMNFKLISKKVNPGFYQSKIELLIFEDEREYDSCTIYAFINIIPLIIKFSILNQNFSLNKNLITISDNIEKLEILYSFPGNYYPKNLGKEITGRNKYYIENEEKEGQLILSSKCGNMKFNLNLSLNSSSLISFKICPKIIKYFGLIIFDEYNININSIGIIKNMTKDIFLFNMTNNIIKLNFQYDKNIIDLQIQENEIKPGFHLKLQIKNINIKDYFKLKIFNKSLFIKNEGYPKIIKNKTTSFCSLENKTRNFINLSDAHKFKLYFINGNFTLKKETIDSYDYFNFSTYLILHNKIKQESKNNYEYKYPKENDLCYGFVNDKFQLCKYNNKNLKIALSYKLNNFNFYYSIFINYERKGFKDKINDIKFKTKIISDKITDINEAIGYLISKKVRIEDGNSIINLKISYNKTSIENILIFLMKYSLRFESSEKLKEVLFNIFNIMYPFSNKSRKIDKFFNPTIKNERLKVFLEKFSFIISFVLLCLSPGDILEYEYYEDDSLNNENERKFKYNLSILEKQFIVCKDIYKDYISNKDIIYYNNTIFIHNNNDVYSKYEKQLKENDIKIEDKYEIDNNEFCNYCYNEIRNIINDISGNTINISNLLLFLDNCEKFLMKIPFILSKNENQEQLKACINGTKMIYDYLNSLNKANSIMFSEFCKPIEKLFKEFENFLNKIYQNKNSDKKNIGSDNYSTTKKCKLPFDNKFNIKINEERKQNKINKPFINNEYLGIKIENKNFDSEISFIDSYENKSEIFDYRERKEDKSRFINKIQELSLEEKKTISIEGLIGDLKPKKIENQKCFYLKNDLTDFKQTVYEIKDIRNIYIEKNISTTIILKEIIKIINQKNQKYSLIREVNEMKNLIKKFDNDYLKYIKNNDFYITYSKSSSLLQNIISNLVRKKVLLYNENEILPKTLINGYIDILVDISQMMSEEQRIASLLICSGISIPFAKYGVKIRISVFGERDSVWLLNDDFSSDNIVIQLFRLRDALACLKRIQSFPADALKKLKNSYLQKYCNKYSQILISNLISPQVVDKKLNWNELGQRIIIFGLKSNFEDVFIKENPEIYENILKIQSSGKSQIIQEFFEPLEIISQKDSIIPLYNKIINVIIDDLLDNNRNDKKEMQNINKKEFDKIPVQRNENINMDNLVKTILNEKNKEEKYFSQNIPFTTLNLYKYSFKELPKINYFPNIHELEKISAKELYKSDNSMEEIIIFVKTLLAPLFRLIIPSNISLGKIPCTSGGSLSIQGIKKWICSGFTYPYIFEKQGGKNKKKYNLSFIIDLSQSSLLLCNYSHAIVTIILLLIAPSTIEDNEEIFIDVIINTINGINIIDFNSKCSIFQNFSKINEIINLINEKVINFSCCPGSCVYTAYQLLLERRESKKIFLITDGFVSDKYEIELVLSLIQKCESEGIDFVTIGVGSFPNGIKDIYPNCCYSPSITYLHDALYSCFITSKEIFANSIQSNLFFNKEGDQEKLFTIIRKEPEDKILKDSIDNEPINIINMIFNENSEFSLSTAKEIINPEEEPYYDIFDNFKILVVILYLGNKEHDKNITTEIFENNAGRSLKKKGFKYDIVYSYGEAIKKLVSSEKGNCPYSETWIFCSKGDGTLPDKAEDKDQNKITIFLEIVSEFNKNGGALFLFCDNEPFVLEANLLLNEYLKLEEGKINFNMKGNYNNKNEKDRFIFEKGIQKSKNGYFQPEHYIESPGEAERLSLRRGLNRFSEGITLSYAETFDKSENYFPFKPFAYLTDPINKRPFILYYDPKIKKGKISRGPIVLHGGFTSAFYDFQQDGTGRLVISIACWLIRKEEYFMDMRKGIIRSIPRIQYPNKGFITFTFNKWIKVENNNTFSILILDVSGSMERYYSSLINMANNIILQQQKNEENKGVIIFFGTTAKTIVNGKYRLLNINDIKLSNVGVGTNFYLAFKEAEKYIYNKIHFSNKRILFLTDGLSDSSEISQICHRMKKNKFIINIIGFDNYQNNIFRFFRQMKNKEEESSFEHLRKYASENCFFTSKNFNDVVEFCQKVFAAE